MLQTLPKINLGGPRIEKARNYKKITILLCRAVSGLKAESYDFIHSLTLRTLKPSRPPQAHTHTHTHTHTSLHH